MNVFITGWGGFSGSHVAMFLLQCGHRVSTITRYNTNLILKNEMRSDSFELLYGDINNLTSLPKNTEVVIHTAGTSLDSKTNISRFIDNNILATRNLIRLALNANVKKFIFLSSISIYGTINVSIVNEETSILNPSAYGASKLFGELCLRECADKLPSIAVRLPAIVGKGASRHWLATTLQQALKGETIKVFNLHSPFNNAIHIKDLCCFMDKLLSYPLQGFHAITLASEGYLTILSIIEKIKTATNSLSKIVVIPEKRMSFMISIEKAMKYFQYMPRHFENTLDSYLEELFTTNYKE